MADLPDGALMQRAAAGLAAAVVDLLGGAYGRRVVLLVGPGDNGGDALWAGARLAGRGARVEALLLADRVHEGGLAALRAAGGRATHDLDDLATAPDLVVDGIVGIGGRPGLRPDAVAALARFAGVPVVAVDVPSGVDVDTGRVDGPHVVADLTVTFGTHKVAHLVDPASHRQRRPAPGRPRSRPRCAGGRGAPARRRTSAAAAARAGSRTSTPAASSAYAPAPAPTPAPRCSRWPAPTPAWSAWCATSVPRRSRTPSGPPTPRSSAPDACRRGWSGPVAVTTPGRCSPTPARTAYPSSWTPTPCATWPTRCRAASSPRTPASSPRCWAWSVPRSRPTRCAFAREAARRWDCVVLLKGHHTLVADPAGRVRVTTTGVPWLATAGAGDVLAGPGRRPPRGRPGAVRRRVGRVVAARRRRDRGRGRRSADREPGRGPDPPAGARDAVCPHITSVGMIAPMTDPVPHRAEIVVDLAAIRHNVRILKDLVSVDGPVQLMAVVKADGYGHGMVEAAEAARDGGADWLGVATIDEALALRAAGDRGPLLCWLSAPGDDFAAAVAAGVEVTAYTVAELDEIAAVGGARVQLKVDTGLSRGGAPRAEWRALFAAAAAHEAAGRVRVTGIWSHFAASDEPAHPANDRAGGRLPRGAAPGRGGRARPRGDPPRQLGGRHPAPVVPLRPGPLRHRVLRARPRARRHPPAGPAAGDDRARAAGDEQADRGRRRRLLRPHLGRRPRHHRRRRPGRLRRGHPARGRQHRVGVGRRLAATDPRPGLHGPVRRRPPGRAAAVGDRGAPLRPRRPRRAHRPGLGRGGRHHQLRDRDPDRRSAGPPPRRHGRSTRTTTEGTTR